MNDDLTELMELVHRAQRAIHRSQLLGDKPVPPWKAATNLTMAQLRALMAIDDAGHLTVGQLAERLGTGMPAASSIVDRLVEEGFAEREQDPGDRRRIVVRPSAAGSERIDAMRQGPKEVLVALISRLTVEERLQLLAGMRGMVRAAEELPTKAEAADATKTAVAAG